MPSDSDMSCLFKIIICWIIKNIHSNIIDDTNNGMSLMAN